MTLLGWDNRLTDSIYSLTRDNPSAQHFFYFLGTYLIYLLPVMLLILCWQKPTRVISAKIFVMAIISWLIFNKGLGDWLYSHYHFRDRPFAAHGLTELLFEQPQKAFPSDHAVVLGFVTLALVYYGQKMWAWTFLVITLVACFARVALGFHWVGDILGGWAVGAIGFALLVWLDPILTRIGNWFFGLFRRSQENDARIG